VCHQRPDRAQHPRSGDEEECSPGPQSSQGAGVYEADVRVRLGRGASASCVRPRRPSDIGRRRAADSRTTRTAMRNRADRTRTTPTVHAASTRCVILPCDDGDHGGTPVSVSLASRCPPLDGERHRRRRSRRRTWHLRAAPSARGAPIAAMICQRSRNSIRERGATTRPRSG
jgi:hypothetical protein